MPKIIRSEQLLDYNPGMSQNVMGAAEGGMNFLTEFMRKKGILSEEQKAAEFDKRIREAIRQQSGIDVPEGAGGSAWPEAFKSILAQREAQNDPEIALKEKMLGLRGGELDVRREQMGMNNDINKQRLALEQEKLQAVQSGNQIEAQRLQAEIDKQNAQAQQMQNLQAGGQFKPKSMTVGGVNFERVPTEEERQAELQNKAQEEQAKESRKGLPIETGGKLAMVKQAKNDIAEVRQMLFPDGTAESFDRGRAFNSNLPMSRAPILGAVIPQAMPFNEMGQKIYSRLQNAVAAKLRVETGAQANPSEVENILARFGITSASNPKAAFDALQRLEGFMDETINITDPAGRFSKPVGNKIGRFIVEEQ